LNKQIKQIFLHSQIYRGLRNLSSYEVVLRFIHAQEFEHNECLTIFVKKQDFVMRKIRWSPPEEASRSFGIETAMNTDPYTYGSDSLLDKHLVKAILESFPKNSVPLPKKGIYLGRPIIRTLSIPTLGIRVQWWSDEDSQELDGWVAEFIGL
jgi:hypothetical protein